ncbi:MAG TPA: WhiB family transcriptional regulator [Nitriliruptorales bacterium]|nr:WhiB family transcriptional regulator [Nitriliruptorales bacterium]
MEWRADAACAAEDPELFFPTGTAGPEARDQIAAAKSVCRRCRVRIPCLEFAIVHGEDEGIWGGTTPEERRTLLLQTSQQRVRALMRTAAGL